MRAVTPESFRGCPRNQSSASRSCFRRYSRSSTPRTFEIVGARPSRLALDLVPPVEDFSHFDGLSLPRKSAGNLVGFDSGVTFDFDRGEFHPDLGLKDFNWHRLRWLLPPHQRQKLGDVDLA